MYLHRSLHAFTVVSSNSTIEWQNQQWRPLNSFLILALARLLDPGLNLAPAHGRTEIMHTLLLPQPYCLHHSITAGSCGILSLQLRSSLFQLKLYSNLLVPLFFAVAFHLWFNTDSGALLPWRKKKMYRACDKLCFLGTELWRFSSEKEGCSTSEGRLQQLNSWHS